MCKSLFGPLMSIQEHSQFIPHFWCRNRHLQTILPALFRAPAPLPYKRERLELDDGDFLDLDWIRNNSKSLVVLSHGLEGSSRSPYIPGMIASLSPLGLDFLAWNMRGCGGEPNRHLHWYHSGRSEDLRSVIQHVKPLYESIILIGFSVGGNITLKYLGEESDGITPKIKGALTFSVPLDLEDSARTMESPSCTIYMQWFLRKLKKKISQKMALYPDSLSLVGYSKLRTFADFDSRYTAPLNGFSSANAYWRASSSLSFLEKIRVPTLLISAADDPFLGKRCLPFEVLRENNFVHLEVPRNGGHVGFISRKMGHPFWLEERTLSFISDLNI